MPKKIETQLGTITQRAINAATILFAVDTRNWERETLKALGNIPDDEPIKKVPKLSFKASKETLRLYEQVFFVYYLMGLDSSLDEINELKIKDKKDGAKNVPEIESEITFTVWQGIDWSSVGFPEALRRFKDKPIISPKAFKEAEAAIKATAFSIQRVDEINAVEVMNQAIIKAIENGTVFRDWKDIFLPRIYAAAGYKKTPEFAAWHLETIFRTNQSSVYNAGRWDGIQADDYVLALEYLTVDDERVRDKHADLNGFVALKVDAIWGEIYPPNGYNCRCIASPLSQFRMEKRGIKLTKGKPDLENVAPDFRYNPGLFNYREKLKDVVNTPGG